MAMIPYRSLPDFVRSMEAAESGEDGYPFYAVLLYTPLNGLDQRTREYARSRMVYLNALTGRNCLMFVLEDVDRGVSIEDFRPEDVYEVARHLGASVEDLPCVVFFTDPSRRNETLVLRLRDRFPDATAATNDRLTDFFRSLQAVVDACSERDGAADQGLACLRDGFRARWPKGSKLPDYLAKTASVRDWVVASVTAGATVLTSLSTVVKAIAAFGK
jgi:hypothetical protein